MIAKILDVLFQQKAVNNVKTTDVLLKSNHIGLNSDPNNHIIFALSNLSFQCVTHIFHS